MGPPCAVHRARPTPVRPLPAAWSSGSSACAPSRCRRTRRRKRSEADGVPRRDGGARSGTVDVLRALLSRRLPRATVCRHRDRRRLDREVPRSPRGRGGRGAARALRMRRRSPRAWPTARSRSGAWRRAQAAAGRPGRGGPDAWRLRVRGSAGGDDPVLHQTVLANAVAGPRGVAAAARGARADSSTTSTGSGPRRGGGPDALRVSRSRWAKRGGACRRASVRGWRCCGRSWRGQPTLRLERGARHARPGRRPSGCSRTWRRRPRRADDVRGAGLGPLTACARVSTGLRCNLSDGKEDADEAQDRS